MTKKASSDPAERLLRYEEYQQALAAFSRVASESLAPERLMQHATARISAVAHIEHVKILRYRPDTADLLIVAGVGWKPGVVGHTVMSSDTASPGGRSVQTGMPSVIEDIAHDPEYRYSQVLREHGIVSLVNVPVMIDGRTWGLLEIDSNHSRIFDQSDVIFLSTFANILGVALKSHENEQRAVAAAEQQVQADARWQMLTREMRHRVKNNFQTIVSFLALQRRRADTEDARERLTSVVDRVFAIALAHDQLSLRGEESEVEFADYLRALCANINPSEERISIQVEANDAMLPLDRAVPAGLIVNELVTNALKHAFDGGEGMIRVAFAVEEHRGTASLIVEDNGKGIGARREGGLGLDLVSALAQQLSGKVEQEAPEKGTRIRVTFPLAL
jgi:two-component sensor histidine kinase/putative methionine-R-sulfoxide reductase with GAF domain